MGLLEIQETIKKHITIIKKTIVNPLDFDVVIKVPKNNGQKKEAEAEKNIRKREVKNEQE
ncbi:MAG TPA: hypothetical protein VJI52_03585 [Candidatus Nanoarchaeia archaeon]|nr:hypothetical protein [Candidatus Nanoarchaeia archaeon]